MYRPLQPLTCKASCFSSCCIQKTGAAMSLLDDAGGKAFA